MTNDKDRFTLRMPRQYREALEREAKSIGVSITAVLFRILSAEYGTLDELDKKAKQERESDE